MYRFQLIEMDAFPLLEADAEIFIVPVGGKSIVSWSLECRVKFGPLGWLLSRTMMKMMMDKIVNANLQ